MPLMLTCLRLCVSLLPQLPPQLSWLRLARNCSTQAAATSPAATAAALAPENIRRLVRSICVCTTPAQLRWLAQTETAEDRLQQAEQLPELLVGRGLGGAGGGRSWV
jgi:hypothetical protein